MNAFLQLLKPWEKSNKSIYLCCSNEILRQVLIKLKFCTKILNCHITVDSNFNHYGINSAKDINIIPVIKTNCTTKIYIQSQAFLINSLYKKDFLILQDNWSTPNLTCISLFNTIKNITSHMFNTFFTGFFNGIQNSTINIYSNIADDYYKQLIDKISKLTVFYHDELVKFNCYLYLPPNLQFQENDFLINRLQDFNINFNNCCVAQKINGQRLNANNVNINYFTIIEDANYMNCDLNYFNCPENYINYNNDKFQYLIYLFDYFL